MFEVDAGAAPPGETFAARRISRALDPVRTRQSSWASPIAQSEDRALPVADPREFVEKDDPGLAVGRQVPLCSDDGVTDRARVTLHFEREVQDATGRETVADETLNEQFHCCGLADLTWSTQGVHVRFVEIERAEHIGLSPEGHKL